MAMLAAAEVAAKRTEPRAARRHLRQAHAAARLSRVPFLAVEAERAMKELDAPVARRKTEGGERPMTLEEIDALWRSGELVVDARRREVRVALVEALGEAAPHAAHRDVLLLRAFGARRSSDSLKARLRVEIGRLRAQIQQFGEIRATSEGFVFVPRRKAAVHVVLPIHEGEEGALLALLSDGASWSTSAISKSLGKSQRSVQRALGGLFEKSLVDTVGSGRNRRWAVRRAASFATSLLLASREPRG
jgi:DNA-binding transcriptional ArsR family regulator